jgi:dephospho-CoA kinase
MKTNNSCYTIGITGEIAVGKSYIAKELVKLGTQRGINIYHFNVDKQKHQFINNQYVIDELVGYFGSDILNPINQVDRKILGNKVFGNQEAMQKIKQISEPRVLKRLEEKIQENQYLIFDGALIIDYDQTKYCDHKTILVCANRQVQTRRLIQREQQRGVTLTPEQINTRYSSQLSFEQKKSKLEKAIQSSSQGWIKEINNSSTNSQDIIDLFNDVYGGN